MPGFDERFAQKSKRLAEEFGQPFLFTAKVRGQSSFDQSEDDKSVNIQAELTFLEDARSSDGRKGGDDFRSRSYDDTITASVHLGELENLRNPEEGDELKRLEDGRVFRVSACGEPEAGWVILELTLKT
ncbi:hypothetical protein [Pseudovibrio sp. Tun.PSC04-5.I4]|uniref:hypothetical protein n=1 Tax=Pseudovibrio sp. Tun.PSC04-5.I4 TaxID=1798213 RepID=UPI000890D4E0|nr:hypothetical protein [Pseudovibrio sp. Tun.PSC04-5.I4]SDQ99678.1 hypothetical protein SAMN04515695_2233 [Pseudovibrio sp. Tun.PSC04-5.I4]